MSFRPGQIVETTRKVPFGSNSHIPKNTRGKLLSIKGLISKKYEVEFTHEKYGKVIITADAGNFRGSYSF